MLTLLYVLLRRATDTPEEHEQYLQDSADHTILVLVLAAAVGLLFLLSS